MLCVKPVVNERCTYCKSLTIKFGIACGKQRYRCKTCKRTFLELCRTNAYHPGLNSEIVLLLKEGCGIRSIARIVKVAPGTVIRRIKQLAKAIKKPALVRNRSYEVDELKTYVGKKSKECWVIYAIDRAGGQVVDLKVGSRNKKNIKRVTDTLLLSDCREIYSDRLKIYRLVTPSGIHRTTRYGTNRIERKNLTLRTHLKRLGRKTIAYSKSLLMLEACLKIYFWYGPGLVVDGHVAG